MIEEIEKQLKEILLKTKICENGRRYYKVIPYAHIVWNRYNPENQKIKDDKCLIHHIDKNPLNDSIENLQKMTIGEHSKLHNVGNTHNKGRKCSEEAKRKISLANLGNTHNKGRKCLDETKKKISKSLTGDKNPMYGKTHSVEAKKKISETSKGRKPMLGKRHSEETKKKISDTIKGRKLSEETIHKMSISQKLRFKNKKKTKKD